jgi:hypothetical protein
MNAPSKKQSAEVIGDLELGIFHEIPTLIAQSIENKLYS